MQINGTIRVNGAVGGSVGGGDSSVCGGGGSGGSIALEASRLMGSTTGSLQANGGSGGLNPRYAVIVVCCVVCWRMDRVYLCGV